MTKIIIDRGLVEQALELIETISPFEGDTTRKLRAALNDEINEADTGGFYPCGGAIVTSCDCNTNTVSTVHKNRL